MITEIESNRLVIISDLHLGNPFSKTGQSAMQFLKEKAADGFDICINGDGLEIAQASFYKLSHELPDSIKALRDIKKMGRNVYYVVGNHDIALEHFLEDWGVVKVCPFLNVKTLTQRIRIEHGHLYDPFFIKSPDLYEFATKLAGIFLAVCPPIYLLWIKFESIKSKFKSNPYGIEGESSSITQGALELSRRGFDIVIFGHTHHRGQVTLPNQKQYFNSGSWMISQHFLEMKDGVVTSQFWPPSSPASV